MIDLTESDIQNDNEIAVINIFTKKLLGYVEQYEKAETEVLKYHLYNGFNNCVLLQESRSIGCKPVRNTSEPFRLDTADKSMEYVGEILKRVLTNIEHYYQSSREMKPVVLDRVIRSFEKV